MKKLNINILNDEELQSLITININALLLLNDTCNIANNNNSYEAITIINNLSKKLFNTTDYYLITLITNRIILNIQSIDNKVDYEEIKSYIDKDLNLIDKLVFNLI